MKKIKLSIVLILFLGIVACNSTKKGTSSGVASEKSSKPATSENSILLLKPANGIYVPGSEELAAIQKKYADVTLDKLKQGYAVYTQGACVSCHGPISIQNFAESQWKDILDDMAQKASISSEQKDAVYKYVLAIKAIQSK